MLEHFAFVRDDVLPSWWANAIQRFLSTSAPSFQITRADATHIQVVAAVDIGAAIVSVGGKWRWVEATISRAHPGGAAGSWDVYVTAINNKIDSTPSPGTDNTNYAFALRIVKSGETPTIEAGVVDVYRKVGSVAWSGSEITRVEQTVPVTPTHSKRHATGQPDALSPADIGALSLAEASERLYEPGDIKLTARATITAGWLKCEGQAVSRTTYAVLFEAIGTAYGVGNGTTTFNVPDYRERVPMGPATLTRGAKGGTPTVALITSQLPVHAHGVTDPGHKHVLEGVYTTGVGGGTGNGIPGDNGVPNGNLWVPGGEPIAKTGISVGNAGAGEAHSNMQPYTVCNVWIKT